MIVRGQVAATHPAGGIAVRSIYARETASWAVQGIGQDYITLLIAVPAMFVAAHRARAGDRRAQLVVGALLLYLAYSFTSTRCSSCIARSSAAPRSR